MGRAALFLTLALLAAGWVFARPLEVVDVRTGEVVEGARLEAVEPWFQVVTEPFVGPMLHLSQRPLERTLAWVGAAVLALWIVQRVRRRQDPDGAHVSFFGWALPLAFLPLPFYWADLIGSDVRKLLTPVGLPALALLVLLVRGWRRAPAGGRRAALGRAVADWGGRVGGLLVVLVVFVEAPLPLHRAGERLVAPEGWLVADLHSHSDTTKDARMDGRERLRLFARHGIDLSATTEHRGRHLIDDRWDTERLAEVAAEEGIPVRVLPGAEFTTRAAHLVLLGIEEEYLKRSYRRPDYEQTQNEPPHYGFEYERLIDEVHAEGGLVIVAHWWTLRQWYRIDWELLIDWGVDGFEIGSGGDRAPAELVRAWDEAGMHLVASSDFHGLRKSLSAWTLIDAEAMGPLPDDDGELVRRLFALPPEARPPVMAAFSDPSVPVWLDPLHGVWTYARCLDVPRRLSWLAWLAAMLLARAAWTRSVSRRRPPDHAAPATR